MKNLLSNNIYSGLVISITLAITLTVVNSGCVYQEISTPEVEVPDSVSYNVDVLPIFTENCSVSGCHAAGAIPPDLSADNAYISLTFFGYVDLDNPEQSLLFQKLETGSMKPYATDNERAIILKWIEQGTLNN